MRHARLDRPTFIVGAARSGTTMMGEILSAHPDVAYWIEPKYVWRYGRPAARNDVRTREEATRHVRAYIRARFANFLRIAAKRWFLEKTPSNCFRLPFIHEIFPDARFVHVLRDGRDVAISARKKWMSPPERSALWRRATSFEIPLRDAPFYAADFLRDVVGRQVKPQKAYIWGPQFPGIREVRRVHSVLETCAWQWRTSVEAAFQGFAEIPGSQVHTFHYEEFVRDPEAGLRAIVGFLDVEPDAGWFDAAVQMVDGLPAGRWREAPSGELELIEPILRPTLRRLGYLPTGDAVAAR
jgi:hypothetical protein